MRIFIIIIMVMTIFVNHVLAITPISPAVIKEAQEYGQINAYAPVDEFLTSWMSYEEKAKQLSGTEERSYIYTPFLLLAIDARGKTLAGQEVKMQDSQNVLKDYAGSLVFSVVLNGDDANFIKKVNAVLKQDGNTIKPFHSIIPNTALKVGNQNTDFFYTAQCYFYFPEKDVISDVSAMLQVNVNKKMVKKFYFNLANMK